MIIICYDFSVRFIQALVEASLTWVVGLLTAGILVGWLVQRAHVPA